MPGMGPEAADRLASTLCERGLVERVVPHDGHMDLVMSERAIDLMGRYHAAARSAHGQMIATLDENELRIMLGLMEKVASGVLGTTVAGEEGRLR